MNNWLLKNYKKWKLAENVLRPKKDVDEFVSSPVGETGEIEILELEKFSIISLTHQWILCSGWVPSE